MDSGATHNFVDSATTKRLGLQLQNTHSFAVEVADGEKVAGNCCSKATKLTIRGSNRGATGRCPSHFGNCLA